MSFERARALADAVLLEGYVLYPYRATSAKNQFRWAFGVLAPKEWSDAGGCDPSWFEAECLVEPRGALRFEACVRFLHSRLRCLEEAMDPDGRSFRPAPALDVDGTLHLPWEEGELREWSLRLEVNADHRAPGREWPFGFAGGQATEPLRDRAGKLRGRVVRTWRAVQGRVVTSLEPVEAAQPLLKLRVRVENLTPWQNAKAKRDEVMGASLIAAHLMIAVEGGAFVSLLDPPEWAAVAASGCRNQRTFPVLAGMPGERQVVLSAPIILYDHAQLAPESPGDFFDATEIDELLALRTSLLTDEEKREARATDARSAALIDRVERLPREHLERLHGALRELRAGEMVPRPPSWAPAPGTKVRLKATRRRTDAQDLLYAGQVATVEKVHLDVDGRSFVAVTIDGDPAAELNRWYGRFHYYALDEIEPLVAGLEVAS